MSAPRRFVNGHWVYGAAAQENIIKSKGGWDKFVADIAQQSADETVERVIDNLNRQYRTPIKRIK